MSKGHGKWERAILEALQQVPSFYLIDLLPTPHTRAQTVALNRAARNLEDAGKIGVIRWMRGGGVGGFVSIYRAHYPPPDRKQIIRLKRCTGVPDSPMQHISADGCDV